MTQPQKIPTPPTHAPEEQILVVKREHLFPAGIHKQPARRSLGEVGGFLPENLDAYLALINEKKEFFPRPAMEKDPRYKQIIPYLIFTHTPPNSSTPQYFLMQRTAVASEARLRNKYSLGIGGHIRQEDLSSNSIFAWAQREFHEEVHYTGHLTVEPLGILNDDSDEVGTVHLGLVLLLHGDSSQISVKSELKQGTLASIGDCASYAQNMENWSKLVLEYVVKSREG